MKYLKIVEPFRGSIPFQEMRGYRSAAYFTHFVLKPYELHMSRADCVSFGGRGCESRYQTAGVRNLMQDIVNPVSSLMNVGGCAVSDQEFQRLPCVEGLSCSRFAAQDYHLYEECGRNYLCSKYRKK